MTYQELLQLHDKRLKEIDARFNLESPNKEIMVCSSTGCKSNHGDLVIEAFKESLKEHNINNVTVERTGCFGLCALGPIVIVYPEGTFYCRVTPEGAQEIVQQHIVGGKVATKYLYDETKPEQNKKKDIDFYKKQKFIARKDSEFINPDNILDYIALNGYTALHKALTQMTPQQVIDEVKLSGLRGRGGAGFTTGVKWELTAKENAPQKYVVCNADEGDPGAFMDRSIIESDPHKIVEAMTIAGYAVGASKGFVYLRAEYPLAGERLSRAIEDAKKYGLLGNNIFGTDFSFDLKIKYGAGAFVCGEETALMHSLEGKRGEPRTRPPYPAQKGVFDCPTVLNNVETYANITEIIKNGGSWYKEIGMGKSTGTKVFALSGKVKHTGLIELPMGRTLREIIFDIGGGVPNGKKFKAVQIGGPSGACLPEEKLDLPVTYDDLKDNGAMMGSGGLIVLDEDSSMVEVAKFFLEFICDESCGKCTPCRIGNRRLLELLNKLLDGNGTKEDIDELESLSYFIKENSLCGLGQTSPNPVLSTLKYFRHEYEALVDKKPKVADKYKINKEKCIGCSACSRACPVKCIHGEIRKPFEIDQDKCISCGSCIRTCKFNAVEKVEGE